MKIRFTEAPKGGRHFKVGEIHEFKGLVAEGYARKYIARGWAVEHVEEKKIEEKKPAPVVVPRVNVKDFLTQNPEPPRKDSDGDTNTVVKAKTK